MNKNIYVFLLLLTGLAAAVILSLLFGGADLSASEVFRAFLHPSGADTAATILWHIRIPRILLGLLVGMGLAASGCVFQGMLRNPLADPYTLGISGGAAFGVAVAMVSGLAGISMLFLPLSAFSGTLVCVVLVYIVSAQKNFSVSTLILSGVILGFIFSALVLLIFALSDAQKMHATILWLMGDLSSPDTRLIKIVSFFIVGGVLVLSLFGQELNILTLGEEKASHLGVETESVKKFLFLIASLVAAACVCASGIIGFVGLIIPHIMRTLVGPDHRFLIPASALAGALFLTLCDTVARSVIAPVELPVGVITGLIGGIFFLGFLFKSESIL